MKLAWPSLSSAKVSERAHNHGILTHTACVRAYVRVCVCVCVCVSECVRACVLACVHAYVCVHKGESGVWYQLKENLDVSSKTNVGAEALHNTSRDSKTREGHFVNEPSLGLFCPFSLMWTLPVMIPVIELSPSGSCSASE